MTTQSALAHGSHSAASVLIRCRATSYLGSALLAVVGLFGPGCYSTERGDGTELGGRGDSAIMGAVEDSRDGASASQDASAQGPGGDGDESDDARDPDECSRERVLATPLTVTPSASPPQTPTSCDSARMKGWGGAAYSDVRVGSWCEYLDVWLPDAQSADSLAALFPNARCSVTPTCGVYCNLPKDLLELLDQATYDRLCAALEIDPQVLVDCTILVT